MSHELPDGPMVAPNDPTIQLPEDVSDEIKTKLLNKATDYESRVTRLEAGGVDRASREYKDALYKMKIAQALRDTGTVDTEALQAALEIEEGPVDEEIFSNAREVLRDYVTSDGAHTTGGTGF